MQAKYGICLTKSSNATDQNKIQISYNVKGTLIILVNGNYSIFPKVITKIEQWIQSGGTLIAYQDAIKWLNDNKLIELVLKLASWRQRTFHSSIEIKQENRRCNI
jgi:hypothetical protein